MPVILHFADAHIDTTNYGRRDPETGLAMRAIDFLKALDAIVDAAINERVDLVLFCGDAYKDRTPVPTFQREWGRRMKRLSNAGISTLLLVGNHDISPAMGRAHALQEYETLSVPHVQVLSQPSFLGPDDLDGLQMQVLALPWVSKSSLAANLELSTLDDQDIFVELEERLSQLVEIWLEKADPDLPVVLAAHASVQGAKYGSERSVMLGNDLVLPRSLVCDPRLNYVALGHIHKAQDLNEGAVPPVIYPGSIERVDFGEASDKKYFVIADVGKEKTEVAWREIHGRVFIDRFVQITSTEGIEEKLLNALPPKNELEDAIVRMVIEYPREWEDLIDEAALRRHAEGTFAFQLTRRPQMDARLRIPGGQVVSSLQPIDLLDLYWKTIGIETEEAENLQLLASEFVNSEENSLEG
jgi:DNA repair protein SbcD/Mre11